MNSRNGSSFTASGGLLSRVFCTTLCDVAALGAAGTGVICSKESLDVSSSIPDGCETALQEIRRRSLRECWSTDLPGKAVRVGVAACVRAEASIAKSCMGCDS